MQLAEDADVVHEGVYGLKIGQCRRSRALGEPDGFDPSTCKEGESCEDCVTRKYNEKVAK